MIFPRRRFLGSSLFVLGSTLTEALTTPLWKWRDPAWWKPQSRLPRNVSGAVCGRGSASRADYPQRVGRHRSQDDPSSRPREADWPSSTTTMTDGWTSISPMEIGSMRIGLRDKRRPLICTRTIATARLPTSRKNRDWGAPVGRPASAWAITTTMDGMIYFAVSGDTTFSSTTTETARLPM